MTVAKKLALTLLIGLAFVVALPVASHADGDPANPYNKCAGQNCDDVGGCVDSSFPGRHCSTYYGPCNCIQ